MKIENDQIASIEPFGILDGKPVNLTRLKGGLNLATRVGAKGDEEVLGAASHQAILCYAVEQRFPNFQPMIMKSEGGLKLTAESHSHFLPDNLRKSGHDIYSIQNGSNVEFFVTKLNIRVPDGEAKSEIRNQTLFVNHLQLNPEFSKAFASAVSEKALSMGIDKVKWDN